MKNKLSLSAVLTLVLFSFLTAPIKAQLVAGHKLTNGQVLVGVTNAAPVAQAIAGTSNQITVTSTYTENGSVVLSFPNSVTFPGNVTVTGTLNPTATSYTYNDLTIVYGINTATAVVTNTGATALTVAGGITAGTGVVGIVGTNGKIPELSSTYLNNLSGASLTTLTAANIAAGSLANNVIASSFAVASVTNANLAGSIAPAKITGTAAILGANSFTAAQNVIGGVNISSNATAGSVFSLKGFTLAVSTHGVTQGDVWLENASGTFTIAICTTTVAENAGGCVSDGCWVKK